MKNKGKKPLELYLHIPFCVKKCDYCDFLSGPSGTETRKAYTEALIREIQALPEHLDREVVSVFTGGGTPSLLDASDMERIMAALRDRFEFSENAEITIEANPGTLSSDKLEIYRAAHINRLSLGLQSLITGSFRFLEGFIRMKNFWKAMSWQELPDLTILILI